MERLGTDAMCDPPFKVRKSLDALSLQCIYLFGVIAELNILKQISTYVFVPRLDVFQDVITNPTDEMQMEIYGDYFLRDLNAPSGSPAKPPPAP